MKKGFTLIELLAVIIILVVIMLIATPVVLNVIDKSKEQAYENQKRSIERAAINYAMINYNTFGCTERPITLRELIETNNIEGPIVNAVSGVRFDQDRTMVILQKTLGGNCSGIVVAFDENDPKIIAISSGYYHTLALKEDGTVWAWGRNLYSQLGDGGTTDSDSPIQVAGLKDIVKIEAGFYSSFAIASDGTVYFWGYNAYGDSCSGTTTTVKTPTVIPSMKDAKEISNSWNHTIFIDKNNQVWACGKNDYSQLGDNTTTNRSTPVRVGTLTSIVSVSAGSTHSLALSNNGTVYSWGSNDKGQLGDNTTTNRKTPIVINSLTDVKQISAGNLFSMVLKNDGTVYEWGHDQKGIIGPSTIKAAPTLVTGLSDIVKLTAETFSMAIASDGTAWAWGHNDNGQLGNGNRSFTDVPTKVIRVENIIDASGGGQFTMLLSENGVVWSSGDNTYGQLGNGISNSVIEPKMVPNLNDVVKISNGSSFSLVLKKDGSVWGWGNGYFGQLGNNSNKSSSYPVRAQIENVKDIAAGDSVSSAIDNNGSVWMWGNNTYGTLGDGTSDNIKTIPAMVNGIDNVISVQPGIMATVALKSDGSVWGWGRNGQKALGFSTASNVYLSPVKNNNISGIKAIAHDYSAVIAISSDNSVYAWGNNTSGHFGNGTNTGNNHLPAKINNLNNIVKISTGTYDSLALKSDGTVWGWGIYSFAYGGSMDVADQYKLAQLSNLTDIIDISTYGNYGLALKSDGTVWSWGMDNSSGQLGNGTLTRDFEPKQIKGISDVVAVAAGSNHSLALKSDGTVWSWGNNTYGKLGYEVNPLAPVAVIFR